MAIPDRYLQDDSWPHLFLRTEEQRQTILKYGGIIVSTTPVTATKYICRHCYMEWWSGVEPKPIGVCPARTDKSEYKRLGVD